MHSQNYKRLVYDQTSECNKPITWREVPDQATWEKIKWSVTILAVIMGSGSVHFFHLLLLSQHQVSRCVSGLTGWPRGPHVNWMNLFYGREKESSTARLCIYLCTVSVIERESERNSAARSVTTQLRDVSAFAASVSVSQECIPALILPSDCSANQGSTLMTKEMKPQNFLSRIHYYEAWK